MKRDIAEWKPKQLFVEKLSSWLILLFFWDLKKCIKNWSTKIYIDICFTFSGWSGMEVRLLTATACLLAASESLFCCCLYIFFAYWSLFKCVFSCLFKADCTPGGRGRLALGHADQERRTGKGRPHACQWNHVSFCLKRCNGLPIIMASYIAPKAVHPNSCLFKCSRHQLGNQFWLVWRPSA